MINKSKKKRNNPRNKTLKEANNPRLEDLKAQKFLNPRIFKRISENMHYETFKYLPSRDLLEIRSTNLGGYQLTSNKTLRPRIGNYLTKIRAMLRCIYTKYGEDDSQIKLLFEQTGAEILDFGGMRIGDKGVRNLAPLFKRNIGIREISLGQFCIYIYICIYIYNIYYIYYLVNNEISNRGIISLANHLKFINNLKTLDLCNK